MCAGADAQVCREVARGLIILANRELTAVSYHHTVLRDLVSTAVFILFQLTLIVMHLG